MSRENGPGEEPPAFRDEDWISAAATISLVRNATLSPMAHVALAKRAHAGLLRAHATLMIVNKTQRYPNCELPASFWWAEGHEALIQNWELGDFETWANQKVRYQAFGVRFHREDVDQMVRASTVAIDRPSNLSPRDAGGRPMSALWPDWVGELAAYIHEVGIPAGEGAVGLDAIIATIEERLVERGLAAPSRTTVQATAKAVLTRLRSAGN